MSYYSENIRSYVHKILQLPVFDRIHELTILLESCSFRELHDIFPSIVHSVFGLVGDCNGLGWGLRTTTRQNAPHCFNMMCQFFSSTGTFLRLCYRLLNDAVKFEFPLEILPHKVAEMLRTGQYPLFYTDLLSTDPLRRQVTSLMLNAFDFFMLHFAVHATLPLHEIHPAAYQIHTEHISSAYFHLSMNYLENFLPGNPDGIVYPTDISPMVKTPPTTVQLQPVEPKKTLRYLKLPNTAGLYPPNNAPSCGSPTQTGADRMMENVRGNLWRTESVLYFFVDTWLCLDIEETRNLPSSEFIRLVRVLVKSVHGFANSAFYDNSFMLDLRTLAHPLMKNRFYPFIRSIIGRWPLDSSMYVVLELWLSYIQPWRYTHDFVMAQAMNRMTPEEANDRLRLDLMSNRFDGFIIDNLAIYTQIFVQLLSRFARLDFGTHRNADMLLRMVKTLNQSCLVNKLYEAEHMFTKNSFAYDATPTRKPATTSYLSSPTHKPDGSACVAPPNEWQCVPFATEAYVPMFGPVVQCEVEQLLSVICMAHCHVQHEIVLLRRHTLVGGRWFTGILSKCVSSLFDCKSDDEKKLQQMLLIPQLLEWCMHTLSQMFNVELPNYTLEEREPQPEIDFSQYSNSFRDGDFDISKVSPTMMHNNLQNLNFTTDPAMLPIESHECKFLVRTLHQISLLFNEKYGRDFNDWWQRRTLWGKVARQILSPPMTSMCFDKPRGINELRETALPARLCLRPLASYRSLIVVGVSLLAGTWLWSSPLLGLFVLIFLFVVYIYVLALIS